MRTGGGERRGIIRREGGEENKTPSKSNISSNSISSNKSKRGMRKNKKQQVYPNGKTKFHAYQQ